MPSRASRRSRPITISSSWRPAAAWTRSSWRPSWRPEAFRDLLRGHVDALRARIAEKPGKGTLLVAPEVRLVEPGGIERAIGKAKHVDDRREK
ncbi:MAG: hypothetical protein ACLTDR_01105 [Adlercreutzia equolifaciens]